MVVLLMNICKVIVLITFFFCSDLFEVNHIRTIYHMFIALLILFIFSTLVVDFIDEGRLEHLQFINTFGICFALVL